jgi:hypothetical protein
MFACLNKQDFNLENGKESLVPNFRFRASCCGNDGDEYDWGTGENELMRGRPRKTEYQEVQEGKIWAVAYDGIGWCFQMFWKIIAATFWIG